jgi:hypothetical protein
MSSAAHTSPTGCSAGSAAWCADLFPTPAAWKAEHDALLALLAGHVFRPRRSTRRNARSDPVEERAQRQHVAQERRSRLERRRRRRSQAHADKLDPLQCPDVGQLSFAMSNASFGGGTPGSFADKSLILSAACRSPAAAAIMACANADAIDLCSAVKLSAPPRASKIDNSTSSCGFPAPVGLDRVLRPEIFPPMPPRLIEQATGLGALAAFNGSAGVLPPGISSGPEYQ